MDWFKRLIVVIVALTLVYMFQSVIAFPFFWFARLIAFLDFPLYMIDKILPVNPWVYNTYLGLPFLRLSAYLVKHFRH